MEENAKKMQEIQTEILRLRNQLSADTSDIGDYKVAKTFEARITDPTGASDPYDTSDLLAKRKAARDKINELQAQLEKLQKE